jgi:uncharacterized membrane protein
LEYSASQLVEGIFVLVIVLTALGVFKTILEIIKLIAEIKKSSPKD